MELLKRVSRKLKVTAIFFSLAVVLITPGVMHCSGSIDVPEGNSSSIDLI